MGDSVGRRRARGRTFRLVLMTGAVLLAVLVAASVAHAVQNGTFDHDGARCATGCHTSTSGTGTPGTSTECEACHTGFTLRSGATQECWTCHRPGQDMTPSQAPAGCTGVCHMYVPATGGYTNDQTPHGATPHYAASLRDCTACHGVATAVNAPDGSAHHDTVDRTAPTDTSCLACHNEPPITDLMSWHGDLKTGGDPGDCKFCHVGMAGTHPAQSALVVPRLAATAAMSGADVVVWGSLTAGRAGLADVGGWVQWKGPSDTDDWDAAFETTVTTSASGTYMATVPALGMNAQYRVIFGGAVVGSAIYRPSMSPASWKTIMVMTLVGPRAGVLKFGRSVTIAGSVQPTFPGRQTKVAIQRKAGAEWVNVKTVAAKISAKTGAYSCTYKPLKRGGWRVRASVPAMKSYKAAATSWTTFVVK